MDDSTEASAAPPTDDGHLIRPPRKSPKQPQVFSVPSHVVELLQAEIEIHNNAMVRWNQKLAAAATLSGVPEGARFQFKQNADETFVFITEI